jgi:hypothetical protein
MRRPHGRLLELLARKRAASTITFTLCGAGAKPCWLTEWGISNGSKACPLDDTKRRQAIEGERNTLAQFVHQGKLARAISYTWDGVPPGLVFSRNIQMRFVPRLLVI